MLTDLELSWTAKHHGDLWQVGGCRKLGRVEGRPLCARLWLEPLLACTIPSHTGGIPKGRCHLRRSVRGAVSHVSMIIVCSVYTSLCMHIYNERALRKLHFKVKHGTAQHSTAQHSTAQHSTAQHSTARHSTARHGAARHGAAQHGAAQHGAARRSAAQHSTTQHSMARHSTVRHSTAQHIHPPMYTFSRPCNNTHPFLHHCQKHDASLLGLSSSP